MHSGDLFNLVSNLVSNLVFIINHLRVPSMQVLTLLEKPPPWLY